MSNHSKNINPDNSGPSGEDRFFGNARIPYESSTEEVWARLSVRIERRKRPTMIPLTRTKWAYGLAAGLILLLGIASFLRFYSHTVDIPNGRHLTYILPDGSEVEINARSTLRYHPYWWYFSRTIEFEGEAFFKVKEGKRFMVKSPPGTTEVLGTSFNVYSRNDNYRVACLTGKVKVTSREKETVVLVPGYQAMLLEGGSISVTRDREPEEAISWTRDFFNFTATPFIQVIEEIERQYDLSIIVNDAPGLTYTGSFSANRPVEEVLDIVCKPFGFTFVKQSDGVYKIIMNS